MDKDMYFLFSLVITWFCGATFAWTWLMTSGKEFLPKRGEPP